MDHQWAKWVVYVFMVAIIWALMSGLYFIIYKKDHATRAVKALTFRIGLSILLFILLLAGYVLRWWHPHML